MTDIALTEAERSRMIDCLNNGVEPPFELAYKLFPTALQHDFKTLNRASIPTIEYAGKRSEAAILNEASAFGAGSPLQIVRFFHGGRLQKDAQQLELIKETGPTWETGWKNMIVQGDNLQFFKTCYLDQDSLIKGKVKGKVKVVYMDPPFATKADFQAKEGEDSYSDKVDRAEFVESMRERLIFVRELLADDGSIYVHLDSKMVHYVRVVVDEVFGNANFVNQIIWKRLSAHNDAAKYGPIHDIILFYAKTDSYTWNKQFSDVSPEYVEQFFDQTDQKSGRRYARGDLTARGIRRGETGKPWRGIDPNAMGNHWKVPPSELDRLDKDNRIHWPAKEGGMPRLKRFVDELEGVQLQDIWMDIKLMHNLSQERTNYPTQKPEALLERIILASSNPGDLVMDPFGGSGTTAAVAEKLGRRWITCDFGKHAIYTMQKRLATIAESDKLGLTAEQRKKKRPYGEPPKDFCVVSVGAFDFSKIMDLRKNADAYVAFVLGIFGITERGVTLAHKWRVNNVVAEKDGHPVEVYPIWDDKYLKEVRIDEAYLKGIVEQAGGKLKGDYIIIAPQVCARVGDTRLKNRNGEWVTFRVMTFPYKILEDAARHFQLCEQPDSPENINRLISSVGFYFNRTVEIAAKKTKTGFKVTSFETTLADADGKAVEGLDGLAMILVDTEYDGETFEVDACVYQKDIKDGQVALKGINGHTAIVAVDKHGNESKVTQVKA